MRHFDTAARAAKPAVSNPIAIEFEMDDDILTAYPPTAGQLALFLTGNKQGGVGAIQAMFEFLDTCLSDEDAKVIRDRLVEGMEVEVVVELIAWLIEEWSARPTKSSSASSSSRKTTGQGSTAKARSGAKKAS